MKKPYLILRLAHWIFVVLAYLFGVVLFGIVAGLIPLLIGGEPVPLVPFVPDSPEVPARVEGAINLLIRAPLIFILLHAAASTIRLLLDIRARVEHRSASG